MKQKKTNYHLIGLVEELKKVSAENGVSIWKRIALDLEKPTRSSRIVNLSRLNKYTKDKDVVVVPGKVLGTGELEHNITVAAFSFSGSAKEKINSNGKTMTLRELLSSNPKGQKIKIIG
ncbi:MAG: 50S ribosomal protein L18e [Candidatus Woesearchaeota archaeon]